MDRGGYNPETARQIVLRWLKDHEYDLDIDYIRCVDDEGRLAPYNDDFSNIDELLHELLHEDSL